MEQHHHQNSSLQDGGGGGGGDPTSTPFWATEWLYVILALGVFLFIFKTFYPELQRLRKRLLYKEGFQNNDEEAFAYLEGDEMYHDRFYVDIYDLLVLNDGKNAYEVKELTNIFKQQFSEQEFAEISLLDCGCGTGHHVDAFKRNGFENVIGVDKSKRMIATAQKNFPQATFLVGNVLDQQLFHPKEFTHITCFYFTIYYIEDKEQFAQNCFQWLQPNGILVVHIVNKDKFDPVIPPANPFIIVNPQSYAKKRITTSSVTFDDFIYTASFDMKKNQQSHFTEKFQRRDDKKTFRKQTHVMFMEDESAVVQVFENNGFLVVGKVDLVKVAYDYQYLYVFRKPF